VLTTLTIETRAREELLDITAQVREAVARSGVRDGFAIVASAHTTAGVTINENADPDVARDILHWLRTRIPQSGEFAHGEGNSDAHLKTSLVGGSVVVIIDRARLVLGTWQGIFLAEFDGPRSRSVLVKVVVGAG